MSNSTASLSVVALPVSVSATHSVRNLLSALGLRQLACAVVATATITKNFTDSKVVSLLTLTFTNYTHFTIVVCR